MPSGPEQDLISALQPILRRVCERDPDAARLMSAIGRWLAAIAEPTRANGTAETADPLPTPTVPDRIDEPAAITAKPEPPAVPVRLKLGDASISVPVSGTHEEILAAQRASPASAAIEQPRTAWVPPDLAVVAQRCSLKALACEAAAARQEAGTPEARSRAQERVDRLLDARHALPDCFLWMFLPDSRVTPADLRAMKPCYENLALACGIVERAPRKDAAEFKRAVELLAEAQSAVRRALENAWLSETDRDQNDAFFWLRRVTEAERIYVQHYMRVGDPADPGKHADLRARLETFERGLREGDNRAREGAKLLKKLRYHAAQIANAPGGEHAHDWKVVVESAARLGDHGIVPGDDRLTDALEDLLRLPEEKWGAAEESRGVLRSVRELIAAEEAPGVGAPARVESLNVARVRDWLRGKRAVLIGGERYPHAAQRIQRAFGLAELHWIELTEHGRTAPIDPPIADPTTAVVWAVIKLSGHLHLDVAAQACRTYGRPLVRLPGGYNPSQIAAQTIEQASDAFASV